MKKLDGRKLPPMKTLLGFEAVARHLSFRKAAEELYLSHQAISQQIAQLEAALECPLFFRNNRQVRLTAEGERFYDHISPMLVDLSECCEEIRREQRKPCLRIHTYVTVALRWLVPKLSDFRAQYPEIGIQLLSTIHEELFNEQNADLGLVFQPQKLPPHLEWSHLLNSSLYPVAHPNFLKADQTLSPKALTKLPLINISTERLQWQDWFERLNIPYDDLNLVVVDSTAVALEMAMLGEGAVLIYDPVAQRELKSGRLVKLSVAEIEAFAPWGFVCRRDKADWLPIKQFKHWMTEQLAQ